MEKKRVIKYGKINLNKIELVKKSLVIGEILKKLDIIYEVEYVVGGKFVDYYLVEYDMVIEYFGNYWHAKPKMYESSYLVQQMKLTATEIWENDKKGLK